MNNNDKQSRPDDLERFGRILAIAESAEHVVAMFEAHEVETHPVESAAAITTEAKLAYRELKCLVRGESDHHQN